MILIFSIPVDFSTDDVIYWLEKFNYPYLRLNYLLNYPQQNFSMNIHSPDTTLTHSSAAYGNIDFDQVGAVWYRRFTNFSLINYENIKDPKIKAAAFDMTRSESRGILNSFYAALSDRYWLSAPEHGTIPKIRSLMAAKSCGILIPPTLVTTSKEELIAFITIHGRVITKPVQEIVRYKIKNKYYTPFTRIVDERVTDNLPDNFYPSLFQKYIEKQLEIRVFYLEGKTYAMALMTQQKDHSRFDFRLDDLKKPYRKTPFRLPGDFVSRIDKLMKKLDFNTGSIDMILGPDNEFYFLEINPIGQFGMTSEPCNYYLEKKIATLLITKDEEFKKRSVKKKTGK